MNNDKNEQTADRVNNVFTPEPPQVINPSDYFAMNDDRSAKPTNSGRDREKNKRGR